MSTNDAAYTITLTREQFNALQRGEAVTIQPPKPKKWEPAAGRYLVNASGTVISSAESRVKADSSAVIFGVTYKTRESADKARAAMRAHNRLLAYVAEFDPDFVPDWEDLRQSKYSVHKNHSDAVWAYFCNEFREHIGAVYMSEQCARGLVEKLNSGEVVL